MGIFQFKSQWRSVYLTGKRKQPKENPKSSQTDILTGSLSRKKPLGLSKHGGLTRHLTFGSSSKGSDHCSRDRDTCDSLVSPLHLPVHTGWHFATAASSNLRAEQSHSQRGKGQRLREKTSEMPKVAVPPCPTSGNSASSKPSSLTKADLLWYHQHFLKRKKQTLLMVIWQLSVHLVWNTKHGDYRNWSLVSPNSEAERQPCTAPAAPFTETQQL